MSIFVVFGFWRFCSWLKSPTKHWCLAQWSLFIELVIWYCSSIFTKICVQLRKFCAIEFFNEKIIDWIKKSRWTVVSLSVGTHLFVWQLLSEIGSCFRNILLVGTAWRQFLRKFWFLLVLNINNTKKNFSKCVKVKFYFYQSYCLSVHSTYHPIILHHFELQMVAIFTCIGHIWQGECRLKISANIWKVYCTLAGSVRTFPSIFHLHPNCQFC